MLVQTGQVSLDNYFIKNYYSHIIHLRKPYRIAYQWVLNDGNMIAEETLFVDECIKNIEGAKAVGIRTHFLFADEKTESLPLLELPFKCIF